jgi:hypothetical protein
MNKFLLALMLIFLTGCSMATGEDALVQMNIGQKATAKILRGFSQETTMEDISAILGEPKDGGVKGLNPTWELIHDGKTTQLRAYFISNKLVKIQYISIDPMWGYVTYYDTNGVRVGT